MEQLIDEPTARLAKEKGYNEHAEKFYLEGYGLCYFGIDGEFLWTEKEENPYYDCNGDFDGYEGLDLNTKAYAPTLAVMQTWLRDVHNIHTLLEPSNSGQYTAAFIIPGKAPVQRATRLENINDRIGGSLYFETYEAALEHVLIHALTLL